MIVEHYGDPEVLTLANLPVPEPLHGEVRLKVHAISVNPVDYKWRKNGPFTSFPVVLGWDVSGVIEALGDGVTDFQVGDQVFGMVRFPQEGRAYAEQMIAPVTDIALKPKNLSHNQAAAMTLAALTAHQALEKMKLERGQTVLIHAAAGGVGHYAVQLAKARGAKVIATASGKNRAFVLGLGADEFVDYTAQPFEQVVKNVDAVLDTVGGETLTRSFGVIKKGGWLVTIVVREPSKELIERHGIQAAWVFVHPSRPDLEHLSNLVMSGQLRSHVSQTFPLERVADAHRSLETGRTVGKIVLEVA